MKWLRRSQRIQQAEGANGRRGGLRRDVQNRELLALAAPGLLFVLIFSYLPMYGLVLAFKNFKYNLGILGSPWVGLENFRFLFLTDAAWRITRNTLFLNMLFILTGYAASILIALLLFGLRNRRAVKLYQSVLIFPRLLSWVVVGYMAYGLLNPQYGLLNGMLRQNGLMPVDWYSRPELWPGILVFTSLWKDAGMGSVLYYATLMGIDPAYFEAAAIDGANRRQTMFHITLPFLVPITTLMLIMSVGNIIRADFGMFYTMTRNVPTLYKTTDVIDTFVFRALRQGGDTGMAAAAGLYQSVVGFLLILGANGLVRKLEPDNSLF
jgi:putative aldouronate transport system permease protein